MGYNDCRRAVKKQEADMTNRFCSNCGASTSRRVPEGDNRVRVTCEACGTIHYENPKLVVGCIVEQGDSILLCRRSIEPKRGKWTLPAGYLENNETTAQGALRETFEESGANVELLGSYRLFDLPAFSQLYLLFRARLLACPFLPTTESSVVQLLPRVDIPWEQIAFPVITTTLRHYCKDAVNNSFSFEHHVIQP